MKIPKFDMGRIKRWFREKEKAAGRRRETLRRQIRAYQAPIRKFAETYPTPREMLTYVRQPPRQLIPWRSILGTPAPYRPALPPRIPPTKKRPSKRIPSVVRRPSVPFVLSDVDRQMRDMLRDILGWG